MIVIQEIFGLDHHVRADVELWAEMGYGAIAPSMYDRGQRDFTAEHDPDGVKAGRALAQATPIDQAMGDLAACRDFLRSRGSKVRMVGYCWGSSMTWIVACDLESLSAASSFYGSMVQARAARAPRCPVLVRLGRTDQGIPANEVTQALAATNPEVPVYIYESAGHGFNNQSLERYNAKAADLTRRRTLRPLRPGLGHG